MQRRRTSGPTQIRAQQLRQEQTHAEAILWQRLRNRQFHGIKFRRQHPLGRFIVDFYCAEQHLIIEIDGPVHRDQLDRDGERTAILEQAGYRMIRWTNQQIEDDLDAVLDELRRIVSPSPASVGERVGCEDYRP